jgi:hypothetical protein
MLRLRAYFGRISARKYSENNTFDKNRFVKPKKVFKPFVIPDIIPREYHEEYELLSWKQREKMEQANRF